MTGSRTNATFTFLRLPAQSCHSLTGSVLHRSFTKPDVPVSRSIIESAIGPILPACSRGACTLDDDRPGTRPSQPDDARSPVGAFRDPTAYPGQAFGCQPEIARNKVLRHASRQRRARLDEAAVALVRCEIEQVAGPALRSDERGLEHQPAETFHCVILRVGPIERGMGNQQDRAVLQRLKGLLGGRAAEKARRVRDDAALVEELAGALLAVGRRIADVVSQ